MRTRLLIFTVVLIALLAGCSPSRNLMIISTNDIHSAVDRFPSLATLVDQQRSVYPGRVLLVDAGDRWTGNPVVDRASEKYRPVIELMDQIGFDVATFGNHEWDGGENLLATRMSEAEFKKILANIEPATFSVTDVEPYVILTYDGMRVALLGLVTNDDEGHPVGIAENFGQTIFTDPYETSAKYEKLRKMSDLYIALTHLGYEEDSLLAVRSPWLDLIIGGHSHTIVPEGRLIAGTLVTQTGSNLRYAGLTRVTHRRGRIESLENHLVMLDTIAENPKIRQMVENYKNNPELLKPVARTDQALDKTALLNLFSDIMRRGTEADFAFYNVGGMRIDHLNAGEIKRSDIFAAEPFGNVPVTVELTMREIADFIKNKFNSTGKESHSVDLYPSGIGYVVLTDERGEAVSVVFDRKLFPDLAERRFKVAMSDYVNGAYDFAGRGKGVPAAESIADLVFDYFEKNPEVEADFTPRVKIEPEPR